jgi:predicted MFS family arabinose efflux permease
MIRLVTAIVLTATLVGFSLANTHRVPLSFVVGPAIHVRMIFLLFSAFAAGVLTTYFALQIQAVKKSMREKREARERALEAEAEVRDLVST